MKYKHPIIYGFKDHYTWRYFEKDSLNRRGGEWWGSQHFNSFIEAESCPDEKLIWKELKDEPRCKICHAK